MRISLLLALLLLSACYATGTSYNGKVGGNLVIYRPNQLLYFGTYYPVAVDGKECEMGVGGYFVTNIKKPTELTAARWNFSGTSRLNVKPGDYVKVEMKDSRMVSQGLSGMFGGAAGQAATEGSNRIATDDGPFILTKIPAAQAKKDLVGLNQDCM